MIIPEKADVFVQMVNSQSLMNMTTMENKEYVIIIIIIIIIIM